jgi:purine-binding chemotaxis protein CheW
MSDLYLLVQIGGRRAAIPGALVQSVVEIDQIVPVPLAPAHVAGLAALRSRALTVIDTRAAIGIDPAQFETEGRAAVVEVDGHGYALLVDEVADVAQAEASAAKFDATMGQEWDRISLGRIETAVGPAVLVDVAELVIGPGHRRTRAA